MPSPTNYRHYSQLAMHGVVSFDNDAWSSMHVVHSVGFRAAYPICYHLLPSCNTQLNHAQTKYTFVDITKGNEGCYVFGSCTRMTARMKSMKHCIR